MPNVLKRCLQSDDGATAIEYGLLACLIFLAVVGAIEGLGSGVVNVLYAKIATVL